MDNNYKLPLYSLSRWSLSLTFKKAFDTVPRDHLWRLMEELEVPSEYMLAISRVYENVTDRSNLKGLERRLLDR